jgi:hypothetical protein
MSGFRPMNDRVVKPDVDRWKSKAIQNLSDAIPLKSGGGDGTFEGMNAITREELDAKLSATESRIEATLTRLDSKLAHLPTTGQMWLAAGSSVLAVAGVVAAFLAFGSDRFNGGLSVGIATVDRKLGIEQVIQENAEQSKQIEMIGQQMQQVIQALSRQQDEKGQPPSKDGGAGFPMPVFPEN